MASKPTNPTMIDFSTSLGYGLYYLPFIGDNESNAFSFAEQFYSLHKHSLRCQIYEKQN